MKLFEGGYKQELAPEEAKNEEEGVLARFRKGKAGRVAQMFMLVTALSAGSSMVQEAWGQEKSGGARLEQVEKSQQEKAVEFLHALFNMPEGAGANMAQKRWAQEEAARELIAEYALSRKQEGTRTENKDGTTTIHREGHVRVGDTAMEEALNELNGAMGLFADKYFGNHDGKADQEDIVKFNAARGGKWAFETLINLTQQMRSLRGIGPKTASGEKFELTAGNAMGTLMEIYTCTDPAKAQEIITRYLFAKSGGRENIPIEEAEKTLRELINAGDQLADQTFGNKDGKAEIEDMNKLNATIKDSVGLQVLLQELDKYEALKKDKGFKS